MPLRPARVGMRPTWRTDRRYLSRQPGGRCGTADLARCARHAWGVPVALAGARRLLCRFGKLVIGHAPGRSAVPHHARSLAPLDQAEPELRLDHADDR